MKIPKFLFPFAAKGKLSSIMILLHLAVYFAIAWIILQLTKARCVEHFVINSEYDSLTMKAQTSHSDIFSFFYGLITEFNRKDLKQLQLDSSYEMYKNNYALCTWYTNKIFSIYINGVCEKYINTKLVFYPVNISTGIISQEPLDITSLGLFEVTQPQMTNRSITGISECASIPTVGFYLTAKEYSVTFKTSTRVLIYSDAYIPEIGSTYTNIWIDTIVTSSDNIPVVAANIYDTTKSFYDPPTDAPILSGKNTSPVIPILPKISLTGPNNIINAPSMFGDVQAKMPAIGDVPAIGDIQPKMPDDSINLYRGPQGDKGDTGPQGIQGDTGPQGIQGERGYRGDTGETGSQGERGYRGYTGETGSQGERGYTGDTGQQGERGYTGDTGQQGERGYPGEPGQSGERGYKGDKGDTGDTGRDGSMINAATLVDTLKSASPEDLSKVASVLAPAIPLPSTAGWSGAANYATSSCSIQ